MTPTQAITGTANQTTTVFDEQGRQLTVRRLTALDTLRLFKAAGPTLSQNEPWLSIASLAMSVVEIDGVPLPMATTEAQIEGLVEKLGDTGLAAVSATSWEQVPVPEQRINVGNLQGIPS